ncbi:RNA-splicing ligase RtcB [Lewinellaceae bacterium SD302]|nr:RNA-splicing ligase RtcB [Lewinellaceae bacterium SD302]
MANKKIRQKDVENLGYPKGKIAALAVNILRGPFRKRSREWQLASLKNLLERPESFLDDEHWSPLAIKLGAEFAEAANFESPELRKERAPFTEFGNEAIIAPSAKQQLYDALRLPVSVAGALMPDAHHGYGLPIGGVLATEGAVIPYGVGVDIGCRMCLTVYDLPGELAVNDQSRLAGYLRKNTAFGEGKLDHPFDDAILEHETFRLLPEAKRLRDKAALQIGSSGGGNHFVEFGIADIPNKNHWRIPGNRYLAVLSHSGSRGMGAALAMHFTKVAMQETRLPKAQKNLAWLRLDSDAGRAYWAAMQLAGDYATACHDHIHRRMAKSLGIRPIFKVENHHNFAWKEKLKDGREVVVHRKGATPAKRGELGIIPGSMTAPGFIVAGRGNADSLQSASHGAGRLLSRTVAKNSTTRSALKKLLDAHKVTLIGGGLDEAPGAYKDIRAVMRDQADLVDVLGTFTPKVVRMA